MHDPRLERVRPLAERVVRSHGLDLFDVQLRRESRGLVLRVVIDRPARLDEHGAIAVESPSDAIGIDECQVVSHDLGTLLDVDEALDQAYTLEVSSPGLDRPLRGPADYRRFRGRQAKIVVGEPIDGQKHFEGRLEVEGDDVWIQTSRTRRVRIPLTGIARGRLVVEF